jgi:hypothetical protein
MVRRIGERLVNLGVVFLISTVHVSASADEPSDRKEPASSTRESIMKEPVHLTGAQVSILTQAAGSLAQLEEYFEVEAQVPQFLEHFEQAKAILESTLHEGKDVVLRTQENFQKLTSSEGSKQASNAFFSDLIGRYRTQEELLSNELDRDGYRRSRSNTLLLLDYNYAAYKTVATQESLTFDLRVNSSPPNATISFKRDGDATYTTEPSVTETEIKNLVYAVWFVHVELKGYAPQEKQHDAFRESQHVVSFDLYPENSR